VVSVTDSVESYKSTVSKKTVLSSFKSSIMGSSEKKEYDNVEIFTKMHTCWFRFTYPMLIYAVGILILASIHDHLDPSEDFIVCNQNDK
jgi:hypothetical protein